MRTNENNSDEKIGIAGTINNDKVYLLDSKGSYIIDKKEGFMPNYSPKQYNYSLNEKVIFDLKETINPKNNSPFLFAINIRPARYE